MHELTTRSERAARRRRGTRLRIGAVTALIVVAAGGLAAGLRAWNAQNPGRASPVPGSWAPSPRTIDGLRAIAVSRPAGYSLFTAHGAVRFLPGIDLGATTPGHLPGELAITAADYRRWFREMGWFGIRAVRIYTIHPPAFYQQLVAYDQAHPNAPIYLIQGVYLPDESYVRTGNLYGRYPTAAFDRALRDAVAAVRGRLTLPFAHGRASGTWTADAQRWTAGWILGVEWDPYAIASTDRLDRGAPAVRGRYFRSTPTASPAERWIAARMNNLAADEAAAGWTAPIAFVNWPTTDPLHHPNEPYPVEDMVGVDPNHLLPTADWPGGVFASYHVYPYYPDFLSYQPSLQRPAFRGHRDPYAAYLTALRQHSRGIMPVMITEFGVPTSIGSAHTGPLGRTQGGNTEPDAMRTDGHLLREIRDLGMAGAFLFEWTDEWYKRTWNTQLHELPRAHVQLWHDEFTNEQFFGLVATDPVPGTPRVIYRAPPPGTPGAPPAAGAREVTAATDPAFIRLSIRMPGPPRGTMTIGLDTMRGIAGPPPPGSADRLADYALVLDFARRTGQAWVRTRLDPNVIDYTPVPPASWAPGRHGWRPLVLIVDKPVRLPLTRRYVPMRIDDAGLLRYGSWTPGAPGFDNLALWHVRGDVIDLRIPWAMAGISDPSSRQALVPLGLLRARSVTIPGIGVTVAGTGLPAQWVGTVTWSDWRTVRYRERIKLGAGAVRAAYRAVGGGAVAGGTGGPAPPAGGR